MRSEYFLSDSKPRLGILLRAEEKHCCRIVFQVSTAWRKRYAQRRARPAPGKLLEILPFLYSLEAVIEAVVEADDVARSEFLGNWAGWSSNASSKDIVGQLTGRS